MSDIENKNNDVNFGDFEDFADSDDFSRAFDSIGDTVNLDDLIKTNDNEENEDINFAEAFSFDGNVGGSSHSNADGRQEPFFEDSAEVDDFSAAFGVEEKSVAEGEDDFADAFMMEDEVASEEVDDFSAAFEVEEEVVAESKDDFADAFMAEDEIAAEEVDDFSAAFGVEEEVVAESKDDFADAFMEEDEVSAENEDNEVPIAENDDEQAPEEITENFTDETDDKAPNVFDIEEPYNLRYLKWYSGNSTDEVYEFGKTSKSTSFVGNKKCNTIHVNIGYDSYGWMVQFVDDVTMSLRDVREYQIRNGKLPNSSGRIVYGQVCLSFEKVERIVVYEAVKYFSYGA